MTVMDGIPSEPLGLEQSVGQVNEQPESDEGGERIVEGHSGSLSKQIAGVDVADRQRKKDEADRQHDDVHHGNAPTSDSEMSQCALMRRAP
jgi:hypothetical protein